jgi:predicted nuclease with TOPRIM domain
MSATNTVTIAAVKKLVTHLRASRKAIVHLKAERLDLLRQVDDAEIRLGEADVERQQLIDELNRAKAALEDIRDQLHSNLSEMGA